MFYLCGLCAVLLSACQEEENPLPALGGAGDPYDGPQHVITLRQETEDFHFAEFVCRISTEEGTTITRKGEHLRLDGTSILTLETGLKAGVYRLLSLEAPVVSAAADTVWTEYGLGCRVEVSEVDTTKVLDSYSRAMRLSGSGTAEDPFIVSSSDHLKRIRNVANDQVKNHLLTPVTHFLQVADIDMDKASWDSDHEFGWLAIGNLPNNPFRGIYDGDGHTIGNLWAKREHSAGIALFGYTEKAVLKQIRMENPRMEGNFAVGAIVGGAVSAGDTRDKTALFGCTTAGGSIRAGEGSVGVGGIIGEVDTYGMVVLDSCVNMSTAVSGAYGIGGLLGAAALYSQSYLQQCENHAAVTSDYTGAGGLVGSVDSLFVLGCRNSGAVTGARAYNASDAANGGFGTGGIAGGTGVSYLYSCINEGKIDGHTGVGGIIGSTRVGSDELLFNNTLVKSCRNSGAVDGESAVGGICGEAQFGCYAAYNTGDVTAHAGSAYVGGIVGNSSIAVVHNALNGGKVTGSSAESAGGIVGKTTWGALFATQNFGDLAVNARYAGGIIGLAGNYTMVNYCCNAGFVQNSGDGPTGGLVGEIGDPREWSAMNIASCVLGSAECVLGVLGPVIAVTGKALSKTSSAVGKAFKKLVHVLHITETAADWLLITTDTLILIEGVAEMLTEEEAELLRASLDTKVEETDTAVRTEMESARRGFSLASGWLADGLSSGIAPSYLGNLSTVLNFYEASDDNNDIINYNINHKREERYEEIEEIKHVKEIVQKVIAGTCICVAATASIISGFVTGGTTTAIALTAIGSVATVIGGTNAIVEGATDYQNNAVILSQCVNLGKVTADNSDRVGGIAGHLQQYCLVKDCLNAGPYAGSSDKNGGIIGRGDSRFGMERCLSVGTGWDEPMAHSDGDFTDYQDLYFYERAYPDKGSNGSPRSLTANEIKQPGSYHNWDVNGTNSVWQVEERDGYFAIPYHSEMEEAVEEEE
ncbi:hypothetical protein [Parabacteroides sp. ZJ-118]|uniref:hypothetical protein n=1 Tax=Parabacteroides sp. ZJ-118 TaxID=2709398 RepID=UPI0013EBFACD|nr:hypothetical protein [Parabacteroides sp. ZJ-118]